MRTPPLNILVAAKQAYRQTGILCSVQLAQWADESAWGTHCTGRFNFFGEKCAEGEPGTLCWTHEEVRGQLVPIRATFKDYVSPEEAFLAHAQHLCAGRYAFADPLKASYQAFLHAIGPIYATRKTYADDLIHLIQADRLDQYDQPIKGAA